MKHPHSQPLERFWSHLAEGRLSEVAALLDPGGAGWDDPLWDAATGDVVSAAAIPRLAAWVEGRAATRSVQHFRTTADSRRVIVEDVLDLKDGLIWNQAAQRAERAERFQLATAVVGERAAHSLDRFQSIRIYFSTWAVLDGKSRLRVGPISPDERAATREAMDAMPVVRRYFDCLAVGDPAINDLFEPDGYFREPASNYACGRDQLVAHFHHILKLGGVGIEFLTATRQDERLGLELQTVVWGTKRMPAPQAGFAIYELGPHGRLQGSRVYDSVVPPSF